MSGTPYNYSILSRYTLFFLPLEMKSLFTTVLSWGKEKKGSLYLGQKYICAKDIVAFNRWTYFKSLILRF